MSGQGENVSARAGKPATRPWSGRRLWVTIGSLFGAALLLAALLPPLGAAVLLVALLFPLYAWWANHRAISPEQRAYEARWRVADKAVRAAEKQHAKAVAAKRKELAAALKPQARQRVGPLVLTDSTVLINGREYSLTPGTKARVDTAGNLAAYSKSRSTVTRMAAGGMLLGPAGLVAGAAARKSKDRVKDVRELYVLIESEEWAETVRLDPDQGEAARRLVQQLNLAAPHVEQVLRTRELTAERLRGEVTAVERDIAAIEAAKSARAAVPPAGNSHGETA